MGNSQILLLASFFLVAAPLASAADAEPSPAAGAGAWFELTGFSCTVATLISGEDCVFESEAGPVEDPGAQSRANLEVARRLAEEACRASARVGVETAPDADLLALCLQATAPVVESCAIGGQAPLLDVSGRVAPAARPCYLALAEALRRTRLMASASAGCCRCAAAQRCADSARACNLELSAGTPRLSACATEKCAQACASFIEADAGARMSP